MNSVLAAQLEKWKKNRLPEAWQEYIDQDHRPDKPYSRLRFVNSAPRVRRVLRPYYPADPGFVPVSNTHAPQFNGSPDIAASLRYFHALRENWSWLHDRAIKVTAIRQPGDDRSLGLGLRRHGMLVDPRKKKAA